MKLEEKIIKLRKRNAWSQEELAEKLDVTRQTVSK
jgi:DNA-binding XRE family transcriptional regulator